MWVKSLRIARALAKNLFLDSVLDSLFLDTSAHALVMTMSPLVISKAFPPCHTEPLGEVSHNTESTIESKRDFSPFSKAQNDKGEGKRLSMTKGERLKMTRIEIFRLLRKLKMTMYFMMIKA